MAWIFVLNGVALSVPVHDALETRRLLEEAEAFESLKTLSASMGLVLDIGVDSSAQVVTVKLGVDLLPSRYIRKGQTVVGASEQHVPPAAMDEVARRLHLLIKKVTGLEPAEERGIVLHNYD